MYVYAYIVYVRSFFNYEGSVQNLSCSYDCTLLTETFDTELGICWGNFSSFRVNVPITTGIILDFTFHICPCCSLSFWYFSILSSAPCQPPLCLLGSWWSIVLSPVVLNHLQWCHSSGSGDSSPFAAQMFLCRCSCTISQPLVCSFQGTRSKLVFYFLLLRGASLWSTV